jgi:hypothetical protein
MSGINMSALDEAYKWFNRFENSHLPPEGQALRREIESAIERSDRDAAHSQVERLRRLHVKPGPEAAEKLVVCALACYHLGDLKEAAILLYEARHKCLAERHAQAVTLWMQGFVLLELGGLAGFDEPLSLWRESRELFEALARTSDPQSGRSKWYQERVKEINQDMENGATRIVRRVVTPPAKTIPIRTAIDRQAARPPAPPAAAPAVRPTATPVQPRPVRPPEAPPAQPTAGAAPTEKASAKAPGKKKRAAAASAFPASVSAALEAFPILDEIPAGNPGPVAVDAHRIGNLEIEEVLLEGRRHRLVNLRDRSKTINLNPFLSTGERLVVLRVTGDSMNRAGIDSGDYVLLRQNEQGGSEDIVAAEIIDEDARATLKRLRIENGERVLYPESTNPAHQPRAGKDFRVRGVALAVFKPIPDEG